MYDFCVGGVDDCLFDFGEVVGLFGVVDWLCFV